MKVREQRICLYTAERGKRNDRAGRMSDAVLAFFLLIGVLFSVQDLMYEFFCLAGAVLTGSFVILVLQAADRSVRASAAARAGIYILSILCFIGSILYLAQGFLYTVNRVLLLWNLRFGTDYAQFSVNRASIPGSMIFWCLLSVPLAFLILTLVKRQRADMLLMLICLALFAGFILGRSQMWAAVLFLLSGTFGVLRASASPMRRNGVRSVLYVVAACLLFLACVLATGGYEGLSRLTRWRVKTVAQFERFRYGEDTLPKGDLSRAPGLLKSEEETLKLSMENAQEWYLKGFVGGSYDGRYWKSLPAQAYQGEYEGLLKWLGTKDFSAVTQPAGYYEITQAAEGSGPGKTKVQVENLGAYRKYIYLPALAESWTGGSQPKKDWQVCSGRFFGERKYDFEAVEGSVTADSILAAHWIQEPSNEEQEIYLKAESVYHAFVEDHYMEVEDDLIKLIEERFFAEDVEKDFNEVTTQIRRVLRQETRYTESPQKTPDGQDFVRWFLEESGSGNAVHFASAAVMAYRTAGYPARYVEGYHYPNEEESNREGEEVILTGQNAHAWAEVYISGIGWLPVEVVPGMYTEMYTNQAVEGKPMFQVNSDTGRDGLEVEGDSADKKEKEEDEEPVLPVWTQRRVLSVILLSMYACFALYLLLEIQRAVRRMFRVRRFSESEDETKLGLYVANMEHLLRAAKVEGNYNHPMELSEQVEEKIAGISRKEYIRAVSLLQKVRFGEKGLLPHERHTLECFAGRLAKALYQQESVWGRFKVRYWYGN